jgi:hypothetical protein
MRIAYLNLLAALLSLLGGLLWTIRGDLISGLIWIAASAVWLTVGIHQLNKGDIEPSAVRRLLHRFSRLVFWS